MSRGALARCVGDADRFLAQAWGRRAHLHAGTDITGLLGVDDVDHILSTMALRAPAFRVIKGGATLDAGSYTRRARIGSRTVTDLIDVGRVYDHFAGGATIVLQGLQRYWPAVTQLCRELESELTHPLQANAYITPPVAQGLRVHADPHDVFAVQTYGRKQWVLYEGGKQPAADGAGAVPTLDAQLEPGDCLYVPKGVHHAARTVDSPSIHLTLGVKTATWADALRVEMDDVAADPSLAEPLPAGYAHDPDTIVAEAQRRLASTTPGSAAADAHEAVHAAARRFWSSRVPVLTGQLQQLMAAEEIDDRTTVRRRPHTRLDVTCHDDRLEVALGDRTLRMPAVAEPAVRALATWDVFCSADLSEHLDEAGRVTLVRRLVREGLLLVGDG